MLFLDIFFPIRILLITFVNSLIKSDEFTIKIRIALGFVFCVVGSMLWRDLLRPLTEFTLSQATSPLKSAVCVMVPWGYPAAFPGPQRTCGPTLNAFPISADVRIWVGKQTLERGWIPYRDLGRRVWEGQKRFCLGPRNHRTWYQCAWSSAGVIFLGNIWQNIISLTPVHMGS